MKGVGQGIVGTAIALQLLGGAAQAEVARPRVLVVATGGTIAGHSASALGRAYSAGGVGVETLLAGAGDLSAVAELRAEQIASVGSQDMTSEIWRRLAARVSAAFADGATDAVVVTHGTDTLEETAFLLDLVTPPGRPVVLVGAMRPANGLGADGPANLAEAVRVAADPASRGRGVLVVLNDEVHAARRVAKAHTADVGAFRSSPGGPIGAASPAAVRYFEQAAASARSGAYRLPPGSLPRVAILYAHADMDARDVEAVLQPDVAGIVLAGVGAGNASAQALTALAAAARRGVVVVRSSRVGEGAVERDIEIDDGRLGFVAAGDLNPQKSRVLLQLLLAGGVTSPAAVQRAFDEP